MSAPVIREEWRPVLNGRYAVSNYGRVRREAPGRGTWPGRMLSVRAGTNGYPVVTVSPDGIEKGRKQCVHRLVALAFWGPCPDGREVNHRDGNKENNRPENLEYVTSSENNIHALRTGLRKPAALRGEDHHASKLTESNVRAIRRAVEAGEARKRVAVRYGVHRSVVDHIIRGLLWRHVA